MIKYNPDIIKLISIIRSDPDWKIFLKPGITVYDIVYKYPQENKKLRPIKGDNFEVTKSYIISSNIFKINKDKIYLNMYEVAKNRDTVIGYVSLKDINIIFKEGYCNITPIQDTNFSVKVEYVNEKELSNMASTMVDWFCDVYHDMDKNEYKEHLTNYFIHMLAVCKTNNCDYIKPIDKYPREFDVHIKYYINDGNKGSFLISIELDNGLIKDFHFIDRRNYGVL